MRVPSQIVCRSVPRCRRGERLLRPCKQAVACDYCAHINTQHLCCSLAHLQAGGCQGQAGSERQRQRHHPHLRHAQVGAAAPVIWVRQSQLHLICSAAAAAPSTCSAASLFVPSVDCGIVLPPPPFFCAQRQQRPAGHAAQPAWRAGDSDALQRGGRHSDQQRLQGRDRVLVGGE